MEQVELLRSIAGGRAKSHNVYGKESLLHSKVACVHIPGPNNWPLFVPNSIPCACVLGRLRKNLHSCLIHHGPKPGTAELCTASQDENDLELYASNVG